MKTLHKPLLFLLAASEAWAFPPAPYYTLYGIVRDQVGQTISSEGAELLLFKGMVEIGRTPISSTPAVDPSYEFSIRIDQNRAGTVLYSEKAIPAEGPFSLVVEMNGARYYPIEVAGTLTAGKGSERVRLDLTLGEDTDGDGLPDVWEEWQLYQAGLFPDENGDWPIDLITRDGDYDGDTRSNYDEYVAGTFAGDASEFFALEIVDVQPDKVRFEFFGITGKTYFLDRGTDLESWTRIPFAVGTADAEEAVSHTVTSVGILTGFITVTPGSRREFYRLGVR
jgi:hypothetical protein